MSKYRSDDLAVVARSFPDPHKRMFFLGNQKFSKMTKTNNPLNSILRSNHNNKFMESQFKKYLQDLNKQKEESESQLQKLIKRQNINSKQKQGLKVNSFFDQRPRYSKDENAEQAYFDIVRGKEISSKTTKNDINASKLKQKFNIASVDLHKEESKRRLVKLEQHPLHNYYNENESEGSLESMPSKDFHFEKVN